MSVMSPARPRPARGGQQQQQAPRAFRIGVQSTDEIDYDDSRALTASTQDLPVLNIPPAGFLQDLYLLSQGTVAGNAVVTVVVSEDFPWRAFDTITFEDVNNAPIVGPITGWDLYIINKYGGYAFNDDPRFSPIYRLDTLGATTATASSWEFCLRVPVELVKRDSLGSLPNKSGTAMFKLRMRLAASGTLYTTPPTTLPTVRTRVQQADWWEPDATDLKGRPLAQNPPAVQTTQYWSKVDYVVNTGSVRQKLDRVGYLIRNLIFTLRDSGGSRANGEANFFDPFTLRVEGNNLIVRLKDVWLQRMSDNGYIGAAGGNVAAARLGVADNYTGAVALLNTPSKDNGVYVEPFCLDFCHKPGYETRRGYLATSSAARVEAQGTITGAGAQTLTVLTNDVAPANGDDAMLTV